MPASHSPARISSGSTLGIISFRWIFTCGCAEINRFEAGITSTVLSLLTLTGYLMSGI